MLPSGLWRGFWEQPHFGRQFMDDFLLRFAEGQVSGSGRDIIGLFVIRGTYEGGHLQFVKKYLGKHKVVYTGTYDGEGSIHGRWVIPGELVTTEGPFSLSPSPRQANSDDPIQEIGPG
jgi:hypothetical protein